MGELARLTTREVLIAARQLIADPEHWCQGVHRSGKRMCASAACMEVTDWNGDDPAHHALAAALASALGTTEDDDNALGKYNDTHTHAEVLALFDKAIAECDV